MSLQPAATATLALHNAEVLRRRHQAHPHLRRRRYRHSHADLYIFYRESVMKYTGWYQNDFNVQVYPRRPPGRDVHPGEIGQPHARRRYGGRRRLEVELDDLVGVCFA